MICNSRADVTKARGILVSAMLLASIVTVSSIAMLSLTNTDQKAYAESVIANVLVGNGPFGIAFNSANGNLYVTNAVDDTVSVIDGSTNTVVGSPIAVGDGPNAIAFNSANGNLYVANSNDDTVSVIDGSTNTVVGSPIAVGDGPFGIAFNSANGNLYVANAGDDTVTPISGSTNAVGSPIAVGDAPNAIAFNSANGNLYVTNINDDTVSVIDGSTNTVVGSPIAVGDGPYGIAFNSANGNLYVANAFDDTVSVIATTSTPADTTPPDTIITNAFNGKNIKVSNNGKTADTTIQIYFIGTDDNTVSGFECKLDGGAWENCTSPYIKTGLARSITHHVDVRAIDTAGNKDLTPDTFNWTIQPAKKLR